MIAALRYIDPEGGYWEVRTQTAIEQHARLRQFQKEREIFALAEHALQAPGICVEVESVSDHEPRE